MFAFSNTFSLFPFLSRSSPVLSCTFARTTHDFQPEHPWQGRSEKQIAFRWTIISCNGIFELPPRLNRVVSQLVIHNLWSQTDHLLGLRRSQCVLELMKVWKNWNCCRFNEVRCSHFKANSSRFMPEKHMVFTERQSPQLGAPKVVALRTRLKEHARVFEPEFRFNNLVSCFQCKARFFPVNFVQRFAELEPFWLRQTFGFNFWQFASKFDV